MILELQKKLQNYHTLSFADFIKELNKVIAKNNKEAEQRGDDQRQLELKLNDS